MRDYNSLLTNPNEGSRALGIILKCQVCFVFTNNSIDNDYHYMIFNKNGFVEKSYLIGCNNCKNINQKKMNEDSKNNI